MEEWTDGKAIAAIKLRHDPDAVAWAMKRAGLAIKRGEAVPLLLRDYIATALLRSASEPYEPTSSYGEKKPSKRLLALGHGFGVLAKRRRKTIDTMEVGTRVSKLISGPNAMKESLAIKKVANDMGIALQSVRNHLREYWKWLDELTRGG